MVEQLEFYASTGTARFYNDESGQVKRQHCQPVVAFWRGADTFARSIVMLS